MAGQDSKIDGFMRTESMYRAHYKIARFQDKIKKTMAKSKHDEILKMDSK